MATDELTPTQKRMLALLADGHPHRREELHSLLFDSQSELATIRYHISDMRPTLRERGQDILCVLHRRRICYQLVIRVTPSLPPV